MINRYTNKQNEYVWIKDLNITVRIIKLRVKCKKKAAWYEIWQWFLSSATQSTGIKRKKKDKLDYIKIFLNCSLKDIIIHSEKATHRLGVNIYKSSIC